MRKLKIGFVDTFDGAPQFFMSVFNMIYNHPYIPLQMANAVDSDSSQLTPAFRTRYGTVVNPAAGAKGNSEPYWVEMVERDDENPDILFFGDSNFGSINRQQKYLDVPVRIFYTGENVRPSGQVANYGFAFDHFYNDNYMRLPLWVINMHYLKTRFGIDALESNSRLSLENDDPFRRKFCGFVQSNPNCLERNKLFDKISTQIEQIDSAGPLFNNTGFVIPRGEDGVLQKMKWLSGYKFTFAAENGQYPGYTTEKLLEAYLANTVPIYYGSQTVGLDFKGDCFINRANFCTDDEFVNYIKYCNRSRTAYDFHYNQPLFDKERFDNYFRILSNLNNFLRIIVKRHIEWL